MPNFKSHNPLWSNPESMPHWDALGVHPHTIPAVDIFDSPTVKVCINAEWASHLTGMIERLIYLDAWEGTEAEKYAAIDKVVKIISEFDKAENQGECDMYIRFRYKPEDSRVTQVQYEPNGVWTDAFNLTCCEPTQPTGHRFTDGGDMEVSYDGGETWVHDPDDPRDNVVILPPPVGETTSETRCLVAQSVTASIKQQQEQLSADAALWAGINGMVGALITILIFVGIIGSGGALTPLLLGLAAALLEAGKVAFDAAMTPALYNRLQCIVYCATRNDGTIDENGISIIRQKIANEFTGVSLKFIDDIIGIWQVPGMNNAGHSGFTTALTDCSACDCPDCLFDFDFRVEPFDLELTEHVGTWVTGQGYKADFFQHTDTDYWVSVVRVMFAEPCNTALVHMEYFIEDGANSNPRVGYHDLIKSQVTGEFEWSSGFNMPPTVGEHSHTELNRAFFGDPIYGVELVVVNIGQPMNHYIRRIALVTS